MSRRGFILTEIAVTYVLLAFAVVTLVPVFAVTMRASKNTEQIITATYLSTALMEEVLLRKWDSATPLPAVHISSGSVLGADAGETSSDKRTFDDIDDFNGWAENPPQDPAGGAMAAFASYTRTVAVRYVDANLSPTASVTDYKQVTVCTRTAKLKPLCMDTICTNR